MKSEFNAQEWLDILVCPQCQEPLTYSQQDSQFICNKCRLAYPVTEGIPVMLIEEAKQIKLEFH
jgi:uncharacterized protein YbaR (Trm112 family)